MNIREQGKNLIRELKKDVECMELKKLQVFCLVFCLVAGIMCFTNLLVGNYQVGAVLAGFSIVLGVTIPYCRRASRKIPILIVVDSAVFFVMMYTLVSGGESGFSIIWFMLVPPVAMYFFRLYYGGLFSSVLGLATVIYMWTPLHELGYKYSGTYVVRFPIVYLINFVVSFAMMYQLIKSKEKQKEAYQEMKEANAAKGIFLSNMSHEARTPINAILGYNEMVMKESRESNTLTYAANIQAAGRTLLSIVNDTLDFTGIQDGTLYLEKERYSVLSVLQDLVTYGNFNAEKKKLDFRVEMSEELPQELIGDAVRLSQVCTNLISNAIKYTKSGYILFTISWKQTAENRGKLFISIKDTGIGIKEEDIAKLGTSFTRIDERNTKNIQGLGLGLPLVMRILELMGSNLNIQSEYGLGSTFSFELEQEVAVQNGIGKVEIFHKEQLAEAETSNDYNIPNVRILVVDDNVMNQDIMVGMLKRKQAVIDLASNGEEALDKIRENRYDLILMDHMMPVLDGMEALRVIQRENLCPDTAIVVLTANAVNGAKEMYLEAGFDAYLSKPVMSKALYELLEQQLPAELLVRDMPGEKKQEETAQKDAIIEQKSILEKLDFLDTETGMAYCCDNEDFYKEMLRTFVANEKREDIKAFYEVRDWENYRILVHALKSTALSIGATALSEQAKQLELAAKEENHYYIDSHHTEAMREYRKILLGIEEALTEKTEEEKQETVPEKAGRILVVDDDSMNLKIAEKMLQNRFDVSKAVSGKEALDYIEKQHPELILLDLHMPDVDGFEVMEILQKNPVTAEIPVIFLTADNDRDVEIRGFKAGAQDFITKPFVADIMIQRVSRILELSRLQKDLQKEVEKQTRQAEERRMQVERLSDQIINALAETIDAKDSYTNGHSMRVAQYSVKIAERAGKSKKEQERIYYMGMLHDIGKIGIPDSIITKNSGLSDKEYSVTRLHPTIGAEILANISEIPDLGIGARWHHERFDGTGYPDGLAGMDIPEEARMIAVADAYDAMASKRSYRDVLPQQVVYEEIKKGKGTQFDPVFADVMLAIMEEDKDYDMREK
ncbi:MAG: response regulator [Lachnospiraceae bacterium]|nr:response regulator [Lachnospiraceae bacterium]